MILHDAPHSLWAATAPTAQEHSPLEGTVDCDVAVVGAGFTGLRAAHKCAAAGSDVILVDSADVGFGASGRNGGQVNPILPFNGPQALYKMLGSTYFERLTQASLNSADALFSFIKTHNINCQPRQNGWLRVDHCKKARATSRQFATDWNKYGADIEFLDGADLYQMTGSPAYQSGAFIPRGGAVQPLALARGLADLCQQTGVQIYSKTPVLHLKQQSKTWQLTTPDGTINAKWVILATNGYTDGLFKGLLDSIFPIVSVQMATRPLQEAQIKDILPHGHTISDTRRVIMYARREADNSIVFGSHGKMKANGSLHGFEWLQKDAACIFPQIKASDWHYKWGGKLAVTDDRLPHLHEPAKGLITGLGYNGRGVAMSNLMGTILADRVLGASPDSLPFPLSPIKKIPFKNIQMLGKGSAIKAMQLLDRVEKTFL